MSRLLVVALIAVGVVMVNPPQASAAPNITTTTLPNGTLGVPYNQTLNQSGGVGVQWTLFAGNLPTGLALATNGKITGTPSELGGFPFTVRARGFSGADDFQDLAINVNPQTLVVATTALPNGNVNTAYTSQLTTTGGTPPVTWSLSSGSLPNGLTLTPATGVISGSPTAVGQTNFTVKATDSGGSPQTATKALSITVNPEALSITTSSLPQGSINSPYSATLAAAGGTGPYTWSISSGTLPSPLTLNSATGAITGTPTTTSATVITFRVTDSSNPTKTTTKPLTLTINGNLSVAASLPNGAVGLPYSGSLTPAGGTTPYTFNVTSGDLHGLTIGGNSNGRTITGTPTTSGTVILHASLTDSSNPVKNLEQDFSFTVASQLTITTDELDDGVIGTPYAATLNAQGGTPAYSWTISVGSLPNGLALSSAGAITGTPTTAGTFNFTAKATDAGNPQQSDTQTLSIKIATPLSITTASLPDGVTGLAYSKQLAATGGTSPYVWDLDSGLLPPGLVLDGAGLISGSPTGNGSWTFDVRVQDAGDQSAVKTFTITVSDPIGVNTTELEDGRVGVPYSSTLSSSGGKPPYVWTVQSGALPAGLALSSAGVISGTPTTQQNASFTVRVTDSSNPAQFDDQPLTLNVIKVLVITTTSPLPGGVKDQLYSKALAATGGTTPYSWSVTSGSLPDGLDLDDDSGAITGTPTEEGTSSFDVTVSDQSGQQFTRTFSITIHSPLLIETDTLPGGLQGTAYSQQLSAAGGSTPYTWAITSGSLPPGLSLASNGTISGTPSSLGTSTFTARVTDSSSPAQQLSRSYSITITKPLAISTTTLIGGVVGQPYNATLAATGGTTPYTWTKQGDLPTGLGLGVSTGKITGTPTTAGTFAFTIQVDDASSPTQTVTKAFSIRIADLLTIANTSLPDGTVGHPYTVTLVANGGTAPFAWSLSSGTMPAGLSLNASTGVVSGTPTTTGTSSLTFKVTDASNPTQQATATLSLKRVGPTFAITTDSPLPDGTKGVAYSKTFVAVDGTTPYLWSISSGALPGGMFLNASTGVLSGTPSSAGTFGFEVKATDSAASQHTAVKSFSLTIVAPVSITTGTLPGGTLNSSYSTTLVAAGGHPSYTWSITSGTLPAGLSLNTATGTISGIATSTGTSTFTAKVTDASNPVQTASKSFTIAVTSVLSITTNAVPDAVTGQAYSTTIAATGGTAPYTWSVLSGALPTGVSLNPTTGQLSGTPSATGSFAFTVKVKDLSSPFQTATKALTLNVASPLAISTTSLPNATLGQAYSQTLASTGGTAPVSWAVTSGSLPNGLTLNATNGQITGTPTALGNSAFTVTATDSANPSQHVAKSLSITVNPA